jgi:hypothetical protein
MSSLSLPSTRQRLFVAALVLWFVALSVQYSIKVATSTKGPASAIARWSNQLQAMREGVNIVDEFNFPSPPIVALVLYPFSLPPPLVGALAWFYLKVVLALASIAMAFALIETEVRPFPPWAKAATVLLSIRPIMGDLSHGNINLFVLFLLLASLLAFTRKRDLTAGLLMGLAIACRITPALFVPYFVWKRAWTTLAGIALGIVLFWGVVPSLFLGVERNAAMLGSWFEKMVIPFVSKNEVYYSELNNQSLPGLAVRMLSHSPSRSTYVDRTYYTPLEYHNVADLSPATATWLAKLTALLFAALVVWACRTPTASRRGWRLPAEFAIVVLGMLLYSERTWKHHCVVFLVPFAVGCYVVATCRLQPRARWLLVGLMGTATILMATTSDGLMPEWFAETAQIYGAYVGVYLLLLAAMATALLQRDTEPATVPEQVEPLPFPLG